MADLEDAPNRKRRATSYLSKDDVNADLDSPDEEPTERKTFKRASEETIAQRQKVTVRRSGAGSTVPAAAKGEKILLGGNDKPTPPANLVPKPSVADWKAPSLNFGGVKAAGASTSQSAEPSTAKPAEAKSSNVPNAFSVKPFSFAGALGKPPVAAAASEKKADEDEEKKKSDTPATTTGDANSEAPSTTITTSTHSKPTAVAPLVSTGFKFTTNTNWSFGKSAPAGATAANGASSSTSGTPAAAAGGATAVGASPPKVWNFLGGKPSEYKPSALSSHFAKSASDGSKTSFQFGKNVAPPKATEPSAEVLKDLESSKASTEDASSKLSETAPVQTFTGEENETALFKSDAKLFEFDTAAKKWVERGFGLFRFNQLNADPSRHRLVMHAKSTLKLILNSPMFAGMSAMPMEKQPTCVKFTGIPIPVVEKKEAEGETKTETEAAAATSKPNIAIFNLRFKDAETAALALKTLQDALKLKSDAKPADSKASEAPAKAEETKKEETPSDKKE